MYQIGEIIAEVTERKDVGESAVIELDEKKDSIEQVRDSIQSEVDQIEEYLEQLEGLESSLATLQFALEESEEHI